MTLRSIDQYTFMRFTKLTKIQFGNEHMFMRITKLTKILFGNGDRKN